MCPLSARMLSTSRRYFGIQYTTDLRRISLYRENAYHGGGTALQTAAAAAACCCRLDYYDII